MPTIPETLQALYAVQQVDSLIQRAKRGQAALDTGKDATAQAEAAQETSQQKRNAQHKLSGELKDSELKLAAVETKRKNYQQKLYQGTVTNPKELSNIEREIEALGRQRSDLDGRVLELMEQVEQAQAEAATADASARQAQGHQTDVVAAFHSRYEALGLELTDLARQRQEAAARVEDKALLKRYDDVRAKSGGVGIARIEGGNCGGCHMTLASTLIKAVREGAATQSCENCGRLLLT